LTTINNHYVKSSASIVTTQLGIPEPQRQIFIDEAYRLGDTMYQKTNVKAIMSSYSIWEQTDLYNNLIQSIFNLISSLIETSDKLNLRLSNAWSAIYKKGHYTQSHYHLPSHTSFVYYLKSNGKTPIIFDECEFKIQPKDDMLVIFPSYIVHSVPEHKDTEDRVVLAGNIEMDRI